MILTILNPYNKISEILFQKLLDKNIDYNLIDLEQVCEKMLYNLFNNNNLFSEISQFDKNIQYITRKSYDFKNLKINLYNEIKNLNFTFFINLMNNMIIHNKINIILTNDKDIIKYLQKYYKEKLFLINILNENKDYNDIIADLNIEIYNNIIEHEIFNNIDNIINNLNKNKLLENKENNNKLLPNKNTIFNNLLDNLLLEGKKEIKNKEDFKCILNNFIFYKNEGHNFKITLEKLGIDKDFEHLFKLINSFKLNGIIEKVLKNNYIDNIEFCSKQFSYKAILYVLNEFIINTNVLIEQEIENELLKQIKFNLNN